MPTESGPRAVALRERAASAGAGLLGADGHVAKTVDAHGDDADLPRGMESGDAARRRLLDSARGRSYNAPIYVW